MNQINFILFAKLPMLVMCSILSCHQFHLTVIQKTGNNLIRSALWWCYTNFVSVCHNDVTAYRRIMAFFFKFCRLTDEGIDTQRVLGTAVGSRSVKREIFNSAKNSSELLQDVVKEAIENEYLITLMIDEWTKVYTKRRPTDESTSVADNFCTIIIKVVKDIKAIPRTEVKTIHNLKGIDVESLSVFFIIIISVLF